MRTRTLLMMVVVVVLLAVGAAALFGHGDNAVANWLRELHGPPGGGH
jgi:hypothetical protein